MITLKETLKHGISENFSVDEGPKEENSERVLRNNIIGAIRQSWIDSEGKGRDPLYFPLVKYLGKKPSEIIGQVGRYKKLREEFIKNNYQGIEIYDDCIKEATENVSLVGLNQNKLLEGILN